LPHRFRAIFDRLGILAKGDNRYLAPISPIEFFYKFRDSLDRLRIFVNGDNRDLAPISPI